MRSVTAGGAVAVRLAGVPWGVRALPASRRRPESLDGPFGPERARRRRRFGTNGGFRVGPEHAAMGGTLLRPCRARPGR